MHTGKCKIIGCPRSLLIIAGCYVLFHAEVYFTKAIINILRFSRPLVQHKLMWVGGDY